MKGKTEKILCGFSNIFPKYLGKYARKMRAGRCETDSHAPDSGMLHTLVLR
ncbi:hypothetical protein RUMCAL_03252 [Ruminococcus callidus ATCC 27760]|uniref:Uncharacterized protein n=1 Tax=Ruminococcus callidus ATCC 27760 TaxID=411473 RepID=U2K615_9FIRM|nr:hypothetical protein RUMCAL_03252 [Ruminococcus callidus ATCC 27760]